MSRTDGIEQTKSVPIRRSLQLNLIWMVALLGGGILALSFVGSEAAARRFSQALTGQAIERVEAQLEGFFRPVDRQLLILQRQLEASLEHNPGLADSLLAPVMREIPWVTSGMIADDSGREQMLLRVGEEWTARQTLGDGSQDQVVWRDRVFSGQAARRLGGRRASSTTRARARGTRRRAVPRPTMPRGDRSTGRSPTPSSPRKTPESPPR